MAPALARPGVPGQPFQCATVEIPSVRRPLISDGVPTCGVANVMRHEQTSTTLDHYTHSTAERDTPVLRSFASFRCRRRLAVLPRSRKALRAEGLDPPIQVVGVAGFEPTASSSRPGQIQIRTCPIGYRSCSAGRTSSVCRGPRSCSSEDRLPDFSRSGGRRACGRTATTFPGNTCMNDRWVSRRSASGAARRRRPRFSSSATGSQPATSQPSDT